MTAFPLTEPDAVLTLPGETCDMRNHFSGLRCLSTLLFLVFLVACTATASPQISVRVGFDGQVMRYHYAPLRVDVTGLAEPIEGRIVVKQIRGVPGARQHDVSHVVADGTVENGIVIATIPVVEPLNPITVELQDQSGAILAGRTESLRLGIRDWAFPIIVGRPLHVEMTEAVIDSSELPSDWWAFDTAKSVWLVEPISSATVFGSLGEWVVSGGSLVLFSGAEFPKMDSPVLRRLLPIDSPQLDQLADGTYILNGGLKDNAKTAMFRDGRPLLLQMSLGAGSVALVTVRADDITEAELDLVRSQIAPVRRVPTIDRVTSETLRSTVVPRPSYLVTPLLCIALLGLLWVLARAGQRERNAFVPMFLIGLVVALSLWSGWYALAHKTFLSVYEARTNIEVLSSFGTTIEWHTLYSTMPVEIDIEHQIAAYPLPSALPTTKNVSFETHSELERSMYQLQRDERRDLLVNGRARVDVHVLPTPAGVEIENLTENVISPAYIFAGDDVYEIPEVRVGTDVYPLIPSRAVQSLSGTLRILQDWLPIKAGGLWLFMVSDEEETFVNEDSAHKVRQVTMRFVEGVVQ